MKRLAKAIKFASKAHRGQVREGQPELPYITHPIDVINKLAYVGSVTDEDILCAAALHDVIEECEVELATVQAKFGEDVAKIVQEVTREEPTSAVRASLSDDEVYELRNGMLLAEIRSMGKEGQLIKLADRLSNIISAEKTRTPEKLARYQKQAGQMLEIIPREVNPALWDALKERLP
ncbi:MAG: HD domain-containing protein [Fimbriimonadaceae bacterium]